MRRSARLVACRCTCSRAPTTARCWQNRRASLPPRDPPPALSLRLRLRRAAAHRGGTRAAAADRALAKFGISVWVAVLLDKFLYGRASHRLLHELADHGLPMSAGTLAGGLQALAPLFAPLNEVLRDKLRSEPHWHADETRWEVFVELEGKIGHRWYLWVFQSRSVVHYVLDESRSSRVVEAELSGVEHGHSSCDRYSAYKKHARLHPGIVLAFCWAECGHKSS